MEYKEIINKIKPQLEKTIDFLGRELAKIQTGRANPALVSDVSCQCFGQYFPLKQLAAISISGPRQITIQPWDQSYTEGIIKGLAKTGVGANPIVDKDVIRINLPPLSQEYREELLKLISQKQEETRRVIRKLRDEAWSEIQEGFQEKKIKEDDKFRAKDDLQELIDEYSEKVKELGEKKKKEIME